MTRRDALWDQLKTGGDILAVNMCPISTRLKKVKCGLKKKLKDAKYKEDQALISLFIQDLSKKFFINADLTYLLYFFCLYTHTLL